MLESNFTQAILTLLSTVATIAAACAARSSLRISKEANTLIQKGLIAENHKSAALALSTAFSRFENETKPFFDLMNSVSNEWPRKIENYDTPEQAGSNPRPLHHVLYNGAELLLNHSLEKGGSLENAHNLMFAVLRDGIPDLNEEEYKKVCSQVDGSYYPFEETLGRPKNQKIIVHDPAFRCIAYHLKYRVNKDEWKIIWEDAWKEEGFLSRWNTEFSRIEFQLIELKNDLSNEVRSIEHSEFPLQLNPPLSSKYKKTISALEVLLEKCSTRDIEVYKEFNHSDFPELMLYTLSLVLLCQKIRCGLFGANFN